MSTTAHQLLTAEAFARLSQPEDGSRQELVRGVIETMPPPGFYHGRCCSRINRLLADNAEKFTLGYVACNHSGFITERDPDTVRGPDVTYWSRERLPSLPLEGYVSIVPDLVVEIISPSDVFARINRKVQHYLHHHVSVIWIVVPEDRSVTVYRIGQQPMILANGDALTGDPVLPGFQCKVSELFP